MHANQGGQLQEDFFVTDSNNIFTEGKPSSTNIFANLDALRLSPDAAAVAGTSEILSHVPIRKPNRHEFFRTPPDPSMWFDTGVFEDKEERETFFVTPSMREALVGEIKPVLLVPTITRDPDHPEPEGGATPAGRGCLSVSPRR
jgi:hypothetical protein